MSLFVIFVLVPLLDLLLLLQVADWIGGWTTVGLVVLTGVVGASLARWQGFRALTEVQADLARGRLPTDSLLSGLLVLVGAVLLLTPGIGTDVIGFSLLAPPLRRLLVGPIKRFVTRRWQVHAYRPDPQGGPFDAPLGPDPRGPDGRGKVVDVAYTASDEDESADELDREA